MKNHIVRIEEAALGNVLGERFGHSDRRETMDGCEILRQLVNLGNYETLQIHEITIGIHHLPTGAGFCSIPQHVFWVAPCFVSGCEQLHGIPW